MLETILKIQREEFIKVIERHLPEIHYYSPAFLERRIFYVMKKMGFSSWDVFIKQPENDNRFIDKFLFHFTVPPTEFFRDTELWLALKKDIIKRVNNSAPSIWLPESASGEELFSLCILLDNLGLLADITIFAGNKSKQGIENVTSGKYPLQLEMSFMNNYQSLQLEKNISNYYKRTINTININTGLLQNVQFIHAHSLLSQNPTGIGLVLCRNSLLYFTQDIKHKFITHMYNKLTYGGYLALGIKEGKSIFGMDTLFKLDKKTERIYRKK